MVPSWVCVRVIDENVSDDEVQKSVRLGCVG
jgi:hypothetical protein